MANKNYKLPITNYQARDALFLGVLAACVSVAAFFYYFHQHALLLYGDAVAHINIARRVFDSRDPGPLRLGTVWLPLPHLLILPCVLSRWMWRTGVGGAIPSMIAYVAGALGLFRLVRRALDHAGAASGAARVAAWFAALVYLGNPNLIYLQTTAMTEPLYLALFIWAMVFFSEFVQQTGEKDDGARHTLTRCGVLLALAMLTRYDAWFAAAAFGVAAAAVSARAAAGPLVARPPLRRFVVILAAAPALWLAYNAAGWGHPLEFATGPYSAQAIEQRAATATMPHHPGYHSLKVATLYFLKDTKLNLAEGGWEVVWIALALAGSALVLVFARRLWPLLLLWIPLPFYALSIARGGVPIYFPEWWPYSYYNVRYGLQLLPVFAVFVAVVAGFVLTRLSLGLKPQGSKEGSFAARLKSCPFPSQRWSIAAVLTGAAFVALSYGSVWRSPLCLREAQVNSFARVAFERKLARELERLPASGAVLMYLGDHSGALQQAGIPLRRTINETTHPYWEEALARPAQYAQYAVAFGEDDVARAIKAHAAQFEAGAVVENPGQPPATIFRRRVPTQ